MYGLISFSQLSTKMKIILILTLQIIILELINFNLLGQGDSQITGRWREKPTFAPLPTLWSVHGITIIPRGILHTPKRAHSLQ